jgi:hypothetical protein
METKLIGKMALAKQVIYQAHHPSPYTGVPNFVPLRILEHFKSEARLRNTKMILTVFHCIRIL